MSQLTIATSQADAAAADILESHHAQLIGQLAVRVETLVALARGGWSGQVETARDDLVAWARAELLPHATAEEATLYTAAANNPQARLLVAAMRAEHRLIADLVDRVSAAPDVIAAATAAGRLSTIVESHVAKENDQLFPLLLEDAQTSVAHLLTDMHQLLHVSPDARRHKEDARGDAATAACSCGETDEDGYPELDARTIPHAIRHATIFGALDAVRPGQGLVLIAPHDPVPLLAQIAERFPAGFAVDYLESGPKRWRLSLARRES